MSVHLRDPIRGKKSPPPEEKLRQKVLLRPPVWRRDNLNHQLTNLPTRLQLRPLLLASWQHTVQSEGGFKFGIEKRTNGRSPYITDSVKGGSWFILVTSWKALLYIVYAGAGAKTWGFKHTFNYLCIEKYPLTQICYWFKQKFKKYFLNMHYCFCVHAFLH